MYQIIIKSALMTALAYLLAITTSRILGKKLVSQLSFFDFVLGTSLGSVIANFAIDKQYTVLSSITILVTLSLLALIIDFAHIKSLFFRRFVNSAPITVVENGIINRKNMGKIRLSVDELQSLLRQKNYFSMSDVEFAVIEPDGKLSVLAKSQKQPLKPEHLNIPTKYVGLTRDIIIDGDIIFKSLNEINLDEEWLMNELEKQGISNAKDVFYAGLDTSGNLYVSRKNKD